MTQVQALGPYLPQDNDDLPESEIVISNLADGLLVLLRQKAPEFWQEVKGNRSLISCLGTYLQFCRSKDTFYQNLHLG